MIQAGIGIFLLATLLASGCAEPNSPGSDNVAATGVMLRITDITAEDGATGDNETDVIIHMCQGGDYEDGLFDVNMTATLQNDSPGEGETQSTKVTIVSYTVEYFSSEPGAVALPPESVVTQTLVISPGGTFSFSGLLMSVDTKHEFIRRGGDPGMMPTYEARVTFYGVNDFGYVVKARGSTYLEIADWDVC
ncbi:MAG: hypothetical protein A2V67_02130 [Deltaproteobacteria bacterium RBG_13_61_14]|nr:MAG: hypothetical protein A2V67_02130 [Deltaproteobacteria bacterium RBG_13_61_14]